jgi:DNA adenine methylase
MKPLVKWSGGKTEELEQIKKHIPLDYDHYIEPFVGGGALYFDLCPEKSVINDIHADLMIFYKVMGSKDFIKIHQFMEKNNNDEETYYKIRKMHCNDDVDTACKFYYLRKTCFRGMLRYNKKMEFNIPYGRYKTMNYSSLIDTRYNELLSKSIIINNDFEEVFSKYNKKENFMFLDPPYDSKFTDYGYCSFGQEEHEKLANLFKSTTIRCLMVIGKTKMIEELYSGYIVEEYHKKYRFKLHSGRINEDINKTHLIIKNY